MADELERIPERWRERFEFYSRETQPFAIQMVQLIRELGQAENRHVQFMVEGGPVVMAADYADLQAKLEGVEEDLKVKNEVLVSMTTVCSNLQDEAERKYQQKLDSLSADITQSKNKHLLKADKEIERLRTENAALTKKNAEIRQLQFKGATVHCYGSHVAPDVESCQENAIKEPEGERLRNELETWLIDNKIAGILMDTKNHFVSVDCAPKLPPNMRSVLTHWGAITVETDEYGDYTPIPSQKDRENAALQAELEQEREDARRIIGLRQDRIDALTAELGNVRTQWNRMRIAKERAEAKNAALQARLFETLRKPVTDETKYWAIVGFYTADIIGVCSNREDVLSEEPRATFIPISKEDFDSFEEWTPAKRFLVLASRSQQFREPEGK